MEKFVFSILVNGAILYFCLFSTELMVLTHYYVLYMASYFLLFFFTQCDVDRLKGYSHLTTNKSTVGRGDVHLNT